MVSPKLLALTTLPPERLADITFTPQPTLDRTIGVCPSQAIAWLACEPHTMALPPTLCPVIGHIIDEMGNSLDDEARDQLIKPYLTSVANTRTPGYFEHMKCSTAVLWAVKVNTPTWLSLADFNDESDYLDDCNAPDPNTTPEAVAALIEQRNTALQAVPDLRSTFDLDADQALGASGFHAVAIISKDQQFTNYFQGIPSITYSAALKAKQTAMTSVPPPRVFSRAGCSCWTSWPA